MFTNVETSSRVADPDTTLISLSGVNHKTSSIELRERFSLSPTNYPSALEQVLNLSEVQEAVVLSTCNRTEVVTVSHAHENIDEKLQEVFSSFSGLEQNKFLPSLYHLRQEQAVSHVFKVAAGIDSMVLGESQILGQLKDSYRVAHAQGATSAVLNRLFPRAFGVAKAVRTKTRIGHNAVSVCYAARELARQVFGDLSKTKVMVFGTGDLGTLAAKHFRSAGIEDFFVVSRSPDRASAFAKSLDAVALSRSNYDNFLSQADIVIGCAQLEADGKVLVDKERTTRVMSERRGRPMLFLDLAVPRNFSSDLAANPGVFQYDLDALGEIIKKNINERSLEVKRAEVIVDEEVNRFLQWLCKRSVDHSIGRLSEKCEAVKALEIEKTIKRLRQTNLAPENIKELRLALSDLSDAVISKILHRPISKVRDAYPEDEETLERFDELFGISRDLPSSDEQS